MNMATQALNVCVVEDDAIMGESLRQRLTLEGFNVDLYQRAHQAFEKIRSKYCDIILCDVRLPDMNGGDLYQKILQEVQHVPPTVFMTAHGTVEHAVELLKLGATDYITKPFDPQALVSKLKSIVSYQTDIDNNDASSPLGISVAMHTIQEQLCRLAPFNETPLLITGESGTGKEIVAHFLHQQQSKSAPFVAVNCSAIPENLIESELFGHEKGSFTGAVKTHRGVFEQAHDGTLFLDEIGDMPLFMQAKLLRVMQERSIKRIGGEKDIAVSLRLIFATNKDLEQMARQGQFREDLYYRINVIHTHLPPLRDRKEDILWLTRRFIKEHQNHYPDKHIQLDESAKDALLNHTWPGNVRELKHTIERACIMSGSSIIGAHDILPNSPRSFGTSSISLKEYMESLEKEKISSVLLKHDWCINQSAHQLNISRKSLWEKMKKYNIAKPK